MAGGRQRTQGLEATALLAEAGDVAANFHAIGVAVRRTDLVAAGRAVEQCGAGGLKLRTISAGERSTLATPRPTHPPTNSCKRAAAPTASGRLSLQ